ncbi:hypothetical protein [Phycicoccus duodecadis]|uniref:DUF5666 domain-containing protein n=1 Tax=Phycicoccus duodecadis TaxID=173053 RepID=A0A2N3YL31_9MICO|nr:hypothetical protein [Phycicoccus duodecadis]PKW27544.1 hypothetical protein ATL31_2391 [Phycicoccus duodecadis]
MATRRPQDPQTPDEGTPAPTDETAPLEAPAPGDAPPPAHEPVSGPPATAAPAPTAAPAWTTAAAAPPPGWGSTPRPPGSVRRAWDEARATGGGRVALAAIGVLSVVLLVALIGLGAALVGDRGHGMTADGRAGTSFGRDQDQGGPGRGNAMGRQGQSGPGRGNGMGRQDPNGQALPPGRQQGGNGQGDGARPMPGMGEMKGLGGLGAVLHGEFTTSVTGAPAVMVVQSGQVSACTPGASLAVKSSDGFSATYVLDASTITPGADTLAVGSTVRVLAAKQGLKAVLVVAGD